MDIIINSFADVLKFYVYIVFEVDFKNLNTFRKPQLELEVSTTEGISIITNFEMKH